MAGVNSINQQNFQIGMSNAKLITKLRLFFYRFHAIKLDAYVHFANKSTNLMIISDVIGVCRDVGDLQVFTAKSTGKELKKRDITMVDNRLVYVSKPN